MSKNVKNKKFVNEQRLAAEDVISVDDDESMMMTTTLFSIIDTFNM